MYQMTTKDLKGTRIRIGPSTASDVLLWEVPAGVTFTSDEKFTATVQQTYQYVGDIWLKVTYQGVTGWMAYIHKGVQICTNYTEVGMPVASMPEYFYLTDPNGTTQRYIKAV